jgi:hypothetical protein
LVIFGFAGASAVGALGAAFFAAAFFFAMVSISGRA